jgi:hypothetical protein
MSTPPKLSMARQEGVEASQYGSAKSERDSVPATGSIGWLCAAPWFVVRQIADILFNRVKTGARAAAAASVDWPDNRRPVELDLLRFTSLSRSYWLMRRHGMIDFNKTGGLTLNNPEALADYIAAVSKSAQADVGAMRLFPANSNS